MKEIHEIKIYVHWKDEDGGLQTLSKSASGFESAEEALGKLQRAYENL